MASGEQHLHLSVRENDKEKLGELLGAGVDINCLFYGWTPLQVAIQEGIHIKKSKTYSKLYKSINL